MTYLKSGHYRDKNLLNMAKHRLCLFRVPDVCFGNPDTTVAAHSNQDMHGKGKALKAQDHYSVWACTSCHSWYDQGSAGREEKRAAFELAHKRQLIAWDGVSESNSETSKDRQSATNALIEYDKDMAFNG